MSDWKRICQNGWRRIVDQNCYTSLYFPVEARSILASWLEEPGQKCMLQFDELNPTYQTHIYGFVQTMISELVQITNALPEVTNQEYNYKIQLERLVKNLSVANPLDIFRQMKQSLSSEEREVMRLQNSSNMDTPCAAAPVTSQSYGKSSPQKPFSQLNVEIKDITHSITVKAKAIDNKVQNYNARCAHLQSERGKCMSRLTEMQQTASQNHLDVQQLSQIETEFGKEKEKFQQIDAELRNSPVTLKVVYSETLEIMPDLQKVYQTAAEELRLFKNEQPLIAIGKEAERDLGKIDEWYEGISDCFESLQVTLQVLRNLCQIYYSNLVSNIQTELDKIGNWRQEMNSSCCVIETQPSQIIRTETQFGPVKLHFLRCSKNMMVEPDRKEILIVLINDVQAAELPEKKAQNSEFIPDSMGKLGMAKSFPRVDGNQVEFKGLNVTKPKRGIKRGEKTIAEEQFHLFLQVTVNIEGTLYKLWTMTLPIMVTTHPTQEADAWATLLWDNALSLSTNQRLPFSRFPVPPNVSWSLLVNLVDLRFLKVGKRLSEENKTHLKNTLFRDTPPANGMVSYNLFCKDIFVTVEVKLSSKKKKTSKSEEVEPLKKFTFWTWLWAALELLNWTPDDPTLISYSLKNLWKEDKLIGFISKSDMQNKLTSACQVNPKTSPFILRFPENRPESIGIYFLGGKVPRSNARGLMPVAYLGEELDVQPLQERILKNRLLTHLYPNIKKEDAFTKVTRGNNISKYFEIGVQEYWPSDLVQKILSAMSDQSTPSPTTSHYFPSYHSQSYNSTHASSPASVHSGHSDNSNTHSWNLSTDSPGSSSTTNLTVGQVANHQRNMETGGDIGFGKWIGDGITADSLMWEDDA